MIMKRFVKGVLNMTVSRAFCAAMFVCVAGEYCSGGRGGIFGAGYQSV